MRCTSWCAIRAAGAREDVGREGDESFVSWWYGVQVSDIGPRRAIRAGPLRRLRMRDRAFGWPVEMVVKAAALGGRLAAVPVSHRPRQAGRSTVSGPAVGSLRAGSALLAAVLRAAREVR